MSYPNTITRSLFVAVNGTSATGAVDLGHYAVAAIDVPTLDATTLKIQGSVDGTTFRDIYDGDGVQQLFWSTPTTGNRILSSESLRHTAGLRWLQVVLGTAQTAVRTLVVQLKSPW